MSKNPNINYLKISYWIMLIFSMIYIIWLMPNLSYYNEFQILMHYLNILFLFLVITIFVSVVLPLNKIYDILIPRGR